MKTQSPLTVVRMAQNHAQTELTEQGSIRPGVFMLVLRNPQTDGRLSQPAAIGSIREEPFATADDQVSFLQDIRTEAARLEAQAIALCVQGEAELTDRATPLPVAVIHIEDTAGTTVLHAPIERDASGLRLGAFMSLEGADAREASGIEPPLLSGESS